MAKIPPRFDLEFIRPISWPEIFGVWRQEEAHQEGWKKHWKERGFDSYDEWRKAYAKPLHPESLEWNLYLMKNPLRDIPLFYGALTRGWIENVYGEKNHPRFKNIVKHPRLKNHPKISDIKRSFPEKTMFTGIVHNGKISLVEGMHRCCALAGWDPAKELRSEITIALADWKEKEIPIIGGDYKNKK